MSALIAVLVLPLGGALAAVALPDRAARAAALAAAAGTLAAAVALADAVAAGAVPQLRLGGWTPPVGIRLAGDGLAAALVLMVALVIGTVAWVARSAMAAERVGARASFGFWPLTLLLWSALNVVFVSRDLFNLYVGIELLGLAAVGLVAIEGKPAALAAAIRYLLFALVGSLLYLAGVALVYAAHGALDMDLLAARTPAGTDPLALALMTAGLMAKTALFPFHVWLPPAHAGAPAPASAMLSALVPKASFVIALRLWTEAMPDTASQAALTLIGALGTLAVLWGSLCALVQTRAKLIVAYSTVAEIGYLFVVFPLLPLAAGAWNGVVFLALSHGLAKAAMFLAVGQWMRAAGGDRLDDLRGMARAMPMTSFAFGLAAVTLAGLPPSGGFTGKYLVMTAAFTSGQWGWALVVLLGGLLAAAYLYRVIAALFAERAERAGCAAAALGRGAALAPFVLAGCAIALGLASAGPLDLVAVGRPAPIAGQTP